MGLIEALAQGQEAGVGQHGHEVGGILLQSDLQGVIVDGLVADVIPVAAVGVVVGAADDDAVDQPLQACLGVEHVMEARLEVVSGDLGVLGSLRGVPVHARTDVEGVDGAVVADVPALGEGGVHAVEVVILDQAVHAVHGNLGIGLGAGVQPVEGDRGGGEGVSIGRLEGVALLGQVSGGVVLALAGQSGAPQLHQVLALLLRDELIGNHGEAETVVVVAPLDIRLGVGGDAADGVHAAAGGGGDEGAGVEQGRLGLGKAHEALVIAGGGLRGIHQSGVVAEDGLVHVLVVGALVNDLGHGLAAVGSGRGSRGLGDLFDLAGGAGIAAAAACEQADAQCQRQQKRQQFRSVFHSVSSYYFLSRACA